MFTLKRFANLSVSFPVFSPVFSPQFQFKWCSPMSLFSKNEFNFSNIKPSKNIPFKKWSILKGDKVIIRSGKDKGKQGTVLRVYRDQNRVVVSGINIKLKKFKNDMSKELKGGLKPIIHSIHVSKVSLIDPETGKPTRIRFGFLADGKKVRVSKKSGSIIEKIMNPGWQVKIRNKNKVDGLHDTEPGLVGEVTYKGENFDKIKKEFEEYIQKKERKESLLVFDE